MPPAETRFAFTLDRLRALPPAPPGQRYRVYDSKRPGLGLIAEVTARGRVTFKVRRWWQGSVRCVTIGRFPGLTPEQARKAAVRIAAKFADDVDPNELRRKARGDLTLAAMFDLYLARYAKPRKKSWALDVGLFAHLKPLHGRRLSKIRKGDVATLHTEIKEAAGPYAANRVRALLSSLYGRAEEWGLYEGPNPCRGVKKFHERSRDRFLTANELPAFFKALAAEPDRDSVDAILLCLLTGARKMNVLTARWEQLDLEAAVWRIPTTKSGDSLMVPIVPAAAELLTTRKSAADAEAAQLPEGAKPCSWVFPGDSREGHLYDLRAPWARILAAAGLADLRIHDLRRTLGSWQAAAGASLAIIGKSLGHRNVSTTLIYSRLQIDPVRDSMERAAGAILAAAVAAGDRP